MTGEMGYINQETGEDNSGNVWNLHAAIAKAVEGELCPFDQYQGPFIQTYAGRLWVSSDDGLAGVIWNEDTRQSSVPFHMHSPESEVVAADLAVRLLQGDATATSVTIPDELSDDMNSLGTALRILSRFPRDNALAEVRELQDKIDSVRQRLMEVVEAGTLASSP